MGLDRVGIDIYDIPRYFRELTVGQRTPNFGTSVIIVDIVVTFKEYVSWYNIVSVRTHFPYYKF